MADTSATASARLRLTQLLANPLTAVAAIVVLTGLTIALALNANG